MILAAWWGAPILDSPIYWALRNPTDAVIVLGLLDIEIQIFNRRRIVGIGVSLHWRSTISIGSRNLVHWGLKSGLLTRWIFMKFVAFISYWATMTTNWPFFLVIVSSSRIGLADRWYWLTHEGLATIP